MLVMNANTHGTLKMNQAQFKVLYITLSHLIQPQPSFYK